MPLNGGHAAARVCDVERIGDRWHVDIHRARIGLGIGSHRVGGPVPNLVGGRIHQTGGEIQVQVVQHIEPLARLVVHVTPQEDDVDHGRPVQGKIEELWQRRRRSG